MDAGGQLRQDAAAGRPSRFSRLLPEGRAARMLVAATLTGTIGSGIFLTAEALYFTQILAIPVGQVALVLTVAGLAGMAAGIPAGYAGDRFGHRRLYGLLLGCGAVGMAALTAVNTLWSLWVVTMWVVLAERAGWIARAALISEVGGSAGRVRLRAFISAYTQLGISGGAVLAGFAIAVGTPVAYRLALVACAVLFAASAVVVWRTGTVAHRDPGLRVTAPGHTGGGRAGVWGDRRYLAVTAVNAVMCLQFDVFGFALPVWIATHTTAPLWLFAACTVLNTALIAVLQVRVSRGTEDSKVAAASMRRAGLTFAVAFPLMAAASFIRGPWPAAAVLLLACLIHTAGELWHNAGSFALRYTLARDHIQGQYQGVYGVGSSAARAIAPTVLGLLCLAWGTPGWILVGLLLAAAGAATPLLARANDQATRPAA